ncbi:MAG: helix-turn-helix domain-containing protein [Verrucomicrobiaceae bacterium]|nr:helix-turn-helix domain-containing protein [Verrucomicrobiaceae bacterium]
MSSTSSDSRRVNLRITAEDYEHLRQVADSSPAESRVAKRAKFMLGVAHGMTVTDAAKLAGFSRPVAYRWLERVNRMGIRAGLSDKPYEIHPRSPESCAWVVSLATSKPSSFAVSGEHWTCDSLARCVRALAFRAGFPELTRVTPGGIHRILAAANVTLPQGQ